MSGVYILFPGFVRPPCESGAILQRFDNVDWIFRPITSGNAYYTPDMHLYVHIPFCDSKCHYCSFNSYVDKFPLREAYMKALTVQAQHDLERFGVGPEQISTLFFGGGTPSAVTAALYAPLFELLRPYLHPDAEITAEANPNSATALWLSEMRALGVNRISFGVQSFDAAKLKRLGRAHSPQQAVNALQDAAEAGYAHLSLDLIYGVAGDTPSLLESDLAQAFSLPIDHLSAYALTIESGTPFAETPGMAEEHLELTHRFFDAVTTRGFEQYEISNFGRYRCRHNLGYWLYRPYIGLGCGAVGTVDAVRYYPHKDPEAYIDDPLFIKTEPLDGEAQRTEQVFLGLRSCVGVDAILLEPAGHDNATWLSDEGILFYENGRYFNRDYLLSDEIALKLLA